LAAKEEKKKDEEKKRAHKKMLACDSLEKRRRAQAREGLPLEASPNIEEEDDNDDEGMEVRMGFSPEVGPGSTPASAGPSMLHSNLRDKAGCISYVRQRRITHIMTKCIEINVTIIIT
jgi:hypothetical protein